MSDHAAPPEEAVGFDAHYAGEQLRRSRHPLRRFVKGFYLRSILQHVQGPTIDYGCGAGQLLERLPAGSLGLEVNPHLIRALQARDLTVMAWPATDAGLDLVGLQGRSLRTLVISHVLEHLPDPDLALRRLLRACARIGVRRVVVVVPGRKGFDSDATHRVFIDQAYAQAKGWEALEGFHRIVQRHFPIPMAAGGAVYTYNEWQLVFDLQGPASAAG